MSELRRRARQARANAFDLSRPDSDDVVSPSEPALGDLLPRVTPAPSPPADARPDSAEPPAPEPQPTPAKGPASRPRGSGGPAAAAATPRRITATAARVPVEVYDAAEDLVKGRGRPSWGQLVAWTCQTRQDEVVAKVLAALRPTPGVLVPRGQNKRGSAATQVTARFTPDEHDIFEGVRTITEEAAACEGLDVPVTATAVIVAALSVASQRTLQH